MLSITRITLTLRGGDPDQPDREDDFVITCEPGLRLPEPGDVGPAGAAGSEREPGSGAPGRQPQRPPEAPTKQGGAPAAPEPSKRGKPSDYHAVSGKALEPSKRGKQPGGQEPAQAKPPFEPDDEE